MLSLNLVVTTGIIFILILLAILFLLPVEQRMLDDKKKKKERDRQKDWQKTAEHQEKSIVALRKEIANLQKKEKEYEQNLIEEKSNIKKWKEKLSQEKRWHDKETQDISKTIEKLKLMKIDLSKAQDNFSKEHIICIQLGREYKELEKDRDDVNEKRHLIEAENIQLKGKIEDFRRELAYLKKDNAELKKKNEEVTWVAKTDYLKLERELREKESELQKLYRELKGME